MDSSAQLLPDQAGQPGLHPPHLPQQPQGMDQQPHGMNEQAQGINQQPQGVNEQPQGITQLPYMQLSLVQDQSEQPGPISAKHTPGTATIGPNVSVSVTGAFATALKPE